MSKPHNKNCKNVIYSKKYNLYTIRFILELKFYLYGISRSVVDQPDIVRYFFYVLNHHCREKEV